MNVKPMVPSRLQHATLLALVLALPLLGGCNLRRILGWDMYNQPKVGKTYKESDFFADRQSSRPLVEGTVPRSEVVVDRSGVGVNSEVVNYAGDGFPDFLTENKAPLEGEQLKKVLERGQAVYNVYCAVCHGRTGMADGMIVRRGFINPPSFVVPADQKQADEMAKNDPHRWERTQLLQKQQPRYIYNVITQGFGAMYSYGERVKPEDRWKVAAYIKALQSTPSEKKPEAIPEAAKPGAHETPPKKSQ